METSRKTQKQMKKIEARRWKTCKIRLQEIYEGSWAFVIFSRDQCNTKSIKIMKDREPEKKLLAINLSQRGWNLWRLAIQCKNWSRAGEVGVSKFWRIASMKKFCSRSTQTQEPRKIEGSQSLTKFDHDQENPETHNFMKDRDQEQILIPISFGKTIQNWVFLLQFSCQMLIQTLKYPNSLSSFAEIHSPLLYSVHTT